MYSLSFPKSRNAVKLKTKKSASVTMNAPKSRKKDAKTLSHSLVPTATLSADIRTIPSRRLKCPKRKAKTILLQRKTIPRPRRMKKTNNKKQLSR